MNKLRPTVAAALAAAIIAAASATAPATAAPYTTAAPVAEQASDHGEERHCFWKRFRVWTYYGPVWKRHRVCYR